MKKVNFLKVVMAFTAVLAFFFLGVEQADAQSSSSVVGTGTAALMATPTGSFVSVDNAQLLIAAELEEIKTLIGGGQLPQSTVNAMMRQAMYYTLLDGALKSGSGVPQSIVFASMNIVTDVYGVTEPIALTLRQEAINLLKI